MNVQHLLNNHSHELYVPDFLFIFVHSITE